MKFINLVFILTCYIHLSLCEDQVKEEDGILVLTDKNFDDVVNKNVTILVELYSPDCGYCQLLAPEYKELAKRLKDENSHVKISKANVEENKGLDKRFKLPGVPYIMLFKKGKTTIFLE